MEREPPAASPSVSRQASEWFVFLQDDPADASLRQRFERWLSASPAHEAAWAETLRAASLSEALLPFDARHWKPVDTADGRLARAEGHDEAAAAVAPQRGGGAVRRKWVMSVGMLAVAAAFAFWAVPAALLYLKSDFRTGTAEVRQIELPDGSTVTLAPGSAIAVAYGAGQRQVHLLAGEAYFSVRRDIDRPFSVKAESLTASVLGTSFDVDLHKTGVGVSVAEGRVQVRAGGIEEILEGGQAIRVAARSPRVDRGTQSPEATAAWRHGQLVMEDRAFGDAVEILERYYAGTIVMVGGALGDRPVTGIFDLRDPEGALRTMAKALGVEVRRVSPWLLVVSAS